MRIITMTMVIFSLIGTVGMAYAQDQSPIEEKRLSNETSISIVNTTGNTDTLSFAGKNDMKYQFNEKWTGSWVVGAIYNETDNKKETERYFTDFRADYIITDRWYAYGLGSWFQDKFSGFDNRIGLGPGLGYHFWMGPRHFLLLEGGLNYTYEDYAADTEDNEQFAEGRLFGKYEWMFTEKTKFSQGIEYLQSFKDGKTWKINSESALITAITDILALKISYSVLYNNDPRPNDIKNTDTILATSLVIGF
jgi:putative salt-induced outer membrane protein